MTTELEVCNMALSLIGGQPLESIDNIPPLNTRERLCNIWLPVVLDSAYKESMWSFISTRAVIDSTGEAEFGGLNLFPLPTDYIHVHRIYRDPKFNVKVQTEDWHIESGEILAPVDPAHILYSARPATTDDLPGHFIEVVVNLLAAKLAMPLTENQNLVQTMTGLYEMSLGRAMAIDGKQARREKTTTGSLIRDRRR